jgi:hypothetical protein
MGLVIRLHDIVSPNQFKVYYKQATSPYPMNSGYSLYGTFAAGTSTVNISGVTINFNSNYWFKIEDQTTGRYIIENIETNDPIAYMDCCPQPVGLGAVCYHSCYPPTINSISCVGLADPTPTPTPTPTSTPTPTPTATLVAPTATPTPTPTSTLPGPTATPTPTPTSTPTPTPTITPTPLPGCSSIVTGEYSGSDFYNYPDNQLNFTGVPNGATINFTCTANDRPNNISIRTALTVLESTGWFGNSSGYDSGDYWYPTEGTGPITLSITYDNTKTYYIDALTAPALAAPNEVNDYWEVSIQCLGVPTPTPTITPTPTNTATPTPTPTPTDLPIYTFYRAAEVIDDNISTTYCNNFPGGQGYNISSPFYTTDSMLIPGSTVIYSDPALVNEIVGSWSLSNVTRMAYITQTEYQNASVTPTTTNPEGDTLYDGGIYKWMRVNSDGVVMSTGTDSCTDGGGGEGPEGPNVE